LARASAPARLSRANANVRQQGESRGLGANCRRGDGSRLLFYIDRTEAEKNLLADIIERYIREVTPTKRGAAPEKSRLLALKRRPIAQMKMSALSGTHVASYRDDRLKVVSPGTVNKELNHLAHLIETARREWGVQLPENPVRLVRRPAQAKARDRRLTTYEEVRLLEACDDARNASLKQFVLLAMETAMRQGELVGLKWEHVNLRKRVAYLPMTKNGEPRSVPLSRKAVSLFRYLSKNKSPTGSVFPGVTAEAIKRAFIRACRRAELEDFRFHDLRHEGTSRLFEKGLNPIEVASITGHKSLQMLRRYTHLRAEDLVKKLG
jgi:integrase